MSSIISVGAIKFSSVCVGYRAQDALMKAASTKLLAARPLSPGDYLVVFSGSVGDVNMAMDTAREVGGSFVVDYLVVANIHPALFPALEGRVALDPARLDALGIIETLTPVSAMVAADAACKAADVELFKLAFDTELNGKGLLLMNGALANVQAAVDAGAAAIRDKGFLVDSAVIPRPGRELFLGPDYASGKGKPVPSRPTSASSGPTRRAPAKRVADAAPKQVAPEKKTARPPAKRAASSNKSSEPKKE
ncbi:MAG: BMC domain-containing protein [Thermoguttaceae bacterium]|jgi:microcompartment protein CcmL/EutN